MGSYDYAGCLSVPRLIHLRGDRLIQEPAPEVTNLRRGQCWKARHLQVMEEEMLPLEGLRGSSLDIELVLDRSVPLPYTFGLCTRCDSRVCSYKTRQLSSLGQSWKARHLQVMEEEKLPLEGLRGS